MPEAVPYLHRNLALLEVNDPLVLDQLFADRKLSEYLLVRLSDRVVIVDSEKIEALYTRLRKLGHLPKMVSPLKTTSR